MTPDEKWDEIQKWVNWSVAYMTLMPKEQIDAVYKAWGNDETSSMDALHLYLQLDKPSKPPLELIYILGRPKPYHKWIPMQFNKIYNTNKELNT